MDIFTWPARILNKPLYFSAIWLSTNCQAVMRRGRLFSKDDNRFVELRSINFVQTIPFMFKLIRYEALHFPVLQQWVTDSYLLFQFAGTDFSFPLTTEQLMRYQENHPDRGFYICLNDEGNPVAFGEIIPQQNNVPRLGRLLVGGEESRGKGLGTIFVKLLMEECIRLYRPSSIDLYVLDKNIQAIKCYQKCGFHFLPEQSRPLLYNGEQFLARKMTVRL